MKKWIDFLGGCCVTLFFLVTYLIMWGINFYKDHFKAGIEPLKEEKRRRITP